MVQEHLDKVVRAPVVAQRLNSRLLIVRSRVRFPLGAGLFSSSLLSSLSFFSGFSFIIKSLSVLNQAPSKEVYFYEMM